MSQDAALRQALMGSCISDAVKNASSSGGPFAALIVENGRPVARGANRVTANNDPTAHAEIEAIRAAAKVLGRFDLSGCEMYSSCEPCPMCLGAIYWARLDRVYFAATRFEAAEAGFDDTKFYAEFALPESERSIPLLRAATDEAGAPFDAWNRNPHRVLY